MVVYIEFYYMSEKIFAILLPVSSSRDVDGFKLFRRSEPFATCISILVVTDKDLSLAVCKKQESVT